MRAVVTGAAGGIGSAIARRLAADRGAQLLLVDIVTDALQTLAAELEGAGARVSILECDLEAPSAGVSVAAAATSSLGGLDTLVSNAGMTSRGPLSGTSVESWDRMFAVNTRATWLLATELYPLLKASRGCVVATASICADFPMPRIGPYGVTKAALVMLIQQLAYDWGGAGIRCNCVSPGPVSTAMNGGASGREERAKDIPLQRLAQAEDVADAVAFLASTDARYITGVNLLVDGGHALAIRRPTD